MLACNRPKPQRSKTSNSTRSKRPSAHGSTSSWLYLDVDSRSTDVPNPVHVVIAGVEACFLVVSADCKLASERPKYLDTWLLRVYDCFRVCSVVLCADYGSVPPLTTVILACAVFRDKISRVDKADLPVILQILAMLHVFSCHNFPWFCIFPFFLISSFCYSRELTCVCAARRIFLSFLEGLPARLLAVPFNRTYAVCVHSMLILLNGSRSVNSLVYEWSGSGGGIQAWASETDWCSQVLMNSKQWPTSSAPLLHFAYHTPFFTDALYLLWFGNAPVCQRETYSVVLRLCRNH